GVHAAPPCRDRRVIHALPIGVEHDVESGAHPGCIRFFGRNGTQFRPDVHQILGFATTRFARDQMLLDLRAHRLRQRLAQIIRKLVSDFFTLHDAFSPDSFRKISRSSLTARWTRTLTVPTSTPSKSAICSYFNS